MMNKHSLTKIAIFLVALTVNTAFAAYDVAKYCQLAKPGTKFPSFDTCQIYFVCNDNGGYTEQRCSPEESFDKNSQSCKASSTVNCYYGVENPCAQTTGTVYVTNPKNCNGYVYCKNKAQVGTGVCPKGQVFNGQACVYGSCTNDEGTTGIVDVGNLCEIMQDGIFFGDFDECNVWHKCSNGQMKNGTCLRSLVFNTNRGMCLDDDGTMCSRVENPSAAPSEPCGPNNANTVKGDQSVCSVYYKCEDAVWNKKTCPDNLYFDVNKNQCLARQSATPSIGCNRCQYATNTWVNSVDPKCEDYLTCSGGKKVGDGTCGDESYFSELRQGCIQGLDDLPKYRVNNGACYKAPTKQTSTPTPDTTKSTTKAAGEVVSPSDSTSTSTEPKVTTEASSVENSTDDTKPSVAPETKDE